MDDLISRQAAINTIQTMYERCDTGDITDYRDMMCESLIVLPSVQPEPSQVARDIATIVENEQDMRVILSQPEIIRCKDCKRKDKYENFCRRFLREIDPSDFCSYAEGKEE